MMNFIIFRNEKLKKICYHIGAALFWLLLWQLISLVIPRLLFAGPIETLRSLLALAGRIDFWRSVWNSFFRVLLGFLAAFLLGNSLGILAYRFSFLHTLITPPLQMMKSMPVASFIIAALIWVSSSEISILISFVVVFPVSYVNAYQGLKKLNRELLEMAEVFSIPFLKRLRYLYLPQLFPFLSGGLKVSAGMCWKAGIAGEIIGLPSHSIGENLYMAKIYLNTGELFAWTAVIIALSLFFEKGLLLLLSGAEKKLYE